MQAFLYRCTDALRARIVPELRYSQDEFEDALRAAATPAVRSWLDLGCGHRMLSEWRAREEDALLGRCPFVVGIDYDLASLARHRSIRHRCRADAGALPFADAAFDLVTANMVVEHLSDPATQFAEIARVLRPGGVFLFHTPNARSYIIRVARLLPDALKRLLARVLENRASADVFPTHYRANTPEAIARAAQQAGLAIGGVRTVLTSPVFSVVPPLALFELLFLRLLTRPGWAHLRPTLICALRRVPVAVDADDRAGGVALPADARGVPTVAGAAPAPVAGVPA